MSLLYLILALGIALANADIRIENGAPSVIAPAGPFEGKTLQSRDGRDYSAFRGIKYANVPGRFKSSLPVEPLTELADATEFGPACPQIGLEDGKASGMTEDCLYLNVYVPETNNVEDLPVMVWIHGGGFIDGTSGNYGADYFMDEDVILVTLNYRLGVFGFFSTADKLAQGNNGLRDQVNALKWVQKNIGAFGGDPGKVTIFGESAGGASVHLLMISPAATGLFRAVISQSGNALCPWSVNTTPVKSARTLGSALNCPNGNAKELIDCLLEKSVEEIAEGTQKVMMSSPGATELPFGPTIEFTPSEAPEDFPIIPDVPYNLLANHNNTSRDVPLMIGHNEAEGIVLFAAQFIISEEQLEKLDGNWVQLTSRPFFYGNYVPKNKLDQFGEQIREYYFGDEPLTAENLDSLINLHTEFFLRRGAKVSTEVHASLGTEVYPYIFKYRGDYSLADRIIKGKGPTHADELQYLFYSLKQPKNWPDFQKGSKDEEFSKKLVKLWTSFAIDLEPKTWSDEVAWSPAARVRAGEVENAWMHLDSDAKMSDDAEAIARVNKLDVLFSKYEQPPLTWRHGNKLMRNRDEF